MVLCNTWSTPANATAVVTWVEITWTGTWWTEPGACEWNCNGWYHRVWNSCVSNNDVVAACDTTTKPENTVITTWTFIQTWNGTGFVPEMKEWTYGWVECGFTCAEDYHWNWSSCVSNSGTVQCSTWTVPENATSTIENVPVTWNGTWWWDPEACVWSCNTTYHKVWETCVSNNDLVVNCDSTTRPVNTVVTVSSFVQAWDGINFVPETKEWTYNWLECWFVCDTNYTRNGSSCVSNSWSGEQQNQEESSTSTSTNSFKKDYCPNWDYSDSYYDWDCWDSWYHSDETWWTHSSAWDTDVFDTEVKEAYDWLYSNKIIDKNTNIQDAEGVLTRWYMAKLIVKFVVKLKLIRPNIVPIECVSWNDDESSRESEEIKNYATLSCVFGVMWINMPNNEFRPNDIVSRAEFGTIISRILWWSKYDIVWDDKTFYYKKHLDALKKNDIMKEIENPLNRKELIKWVWVVLKRISDKK